ncbi:hypothetical protein [Thermogutta sp.]|uniref:hypothetical protein n=1 Tax=Thermogutta sp. TaxID=1962930 RepID=UPI0032203A7D
MKYVVFEAICLTVTAWNAVVLAESPKLLWEVAPFEADITIPIGHACMGGGVANAREIVDPLYAKGFVLRPRGTVLPNQEEPGPIPVGKREAFPIVVLALDWCQLNNEADFRFREALAEAAGTTRQRILLACVHQHDAPIFDLRAQVLLDEQGLTGWLCDPKFFEEALARVVAALKEALKNPRPVTHIGLGQARVEKIASNRKIITAEGRIHWSRSSASGATYGDYPEGDIDPWLKTISLWNNDEPIVAWSSYAVHPMSYYGQGQVSADFPGMARAKRQADDPRVMQIYFTGCAGDTTAGKYNTGDPGNRPVLADRLYRAMLEAWQSTQRYPLESVVCRHADLYLPPRDEGDFTLERMRAILGNEKEKRWRRISAALGLSWRERVAAGKPIEVPCLDFNNGQAFFGVLPAETFVGYQLMAQQLRPDAFVMLAGFGDGAPGYIPTDACWKEGYNDDYCWVAPMTDALFRDLLAQVLNLPEGSGCPKISPTDKMGPTNARSCPSCIRREVIYQELSPDYLWFHPRVVAIPGLGRNGNPRLVLTLQKHLRVSDFYSGLYYMVSDDLGRSWRGPIQIPQLDWKPQPDGSTFAVADVTPGYHPPTGKVLALGAYVYYDQQGHQLHDRPRFSQTAYAIYDPQTDDWSGWHLLEFPDDKKFNLARNACSQWLVEPDGTLLIPVYFAENYGVMATAVFRCQFDGHKLRIFEQGDELHLNQVRGLVEPSIIRCGNWYFLTLRNDLRGYVTRSTDGLHWEPIRPWLFDDGQELGSYDTQQHWISHGDRLYLIYTRRGAMNDHVPRHRAPLFMAEVDQNNLCVLRATERVVLPERGSMMGNFGAATITPEEAWVTVGEYTALSSPEVRPNPKGGDGSVLLGRICWD